MIAIPSDSHYSRQPQFEAGDLVKHRRYGYRGVVVKRDEKCLADDEWYTNNQTQPDRTQPWYHVLVDGTETATYAASENLTADLSGQPVTHPLISRFFSAFENGRYLPHDAVS